MQLNHCIKLKILLDLLFVKLVCESIARSCAPSWLGCAQTLQVHCTCLKKSTRWASHLHRSLDFFKRQKCLYSVFLFFSTNHMKNSNKHISLPHWHQGGVPERRIKKLWVYPWTLSWLALRWETVNILFQSRWSELVQSTLNMFTLSYAHAQPL